MWSLPVRQTSNHFQAEYDSVIISTDANPAPGLSRVSSPSHQSLDLPRPLFSQIATRSSQSDITITTRIPGTTLGAATFFQGTAILHVMFNVTNVIRVLEPGTHVRLPVGVSVFALTVRQMVRSVKSSRTSTGLPPDPGSSRAAFATRSY